MLKLPAKIPYNKVILIQRLTCTALIGLMLVLSVFGSFFRVPFNDDFSVFYEPNDLEDIENSEEEKSERYLGFDFLGSTISVFKMISLSNSSYNEYRQIYYEVVESERLSLMTRASGIAYLVLESFDADFTVGIYYIMLLTISIGTPILLLVLLIIILKNYFKPKFRKTQHSIYKGTLNMFRIFICRVPFIIFLNILVPKTKFGFASVSIITLCAIGIAVNALAPYFKEYTKAQRKYRNMLQFTSLSCILLFVFFGISLNASHLIQKAIVLFDGRNFKDLFSIFKGGNFDIDKIIALFAGFAFFIALFGVCKPLANSLCRIGFTTTRLKKKDYSTGDAYITSCIRPNLVILVFLLLIGSQSELIFYKGEVFPLIITLISIVCLTLVEVAVHVLRETICVDLGKGGMDAVLEGTTYKAQAEDNLAAEAKAQLEEEIEKEKSKAAQAKAKK